MRVLFDHGAPKGVAKSLSPHEVTTALQRGWDRLVNGELLAAAEAAGIDVLFTTDRRMRYQQNFKNRKIALVVLTGTTKWSQVRLHLPRIAAAITSSLPGTYSELEIPFP